MASTGSARQSDPPAVGRPTASAPSRQLHRDWSLYDTAHVVFRPKRLSVGELAQGYAWLYRRLFSDVSIWRRRPEDPRAVLPYLGMSYLYKRSNRFWRFLIRHDLVQPVWRPLVEHTRKRHLRFRAELERRTGGALTDGPAGEGMAPGSSWVSAGV